MEKNFAPSMVTEVKPSILISGECANGPVADMVEVECTCWKVIRVEMIRFNAK